MKQCTYCNTRNMDAAYSCTGCGATDFIPLPTADPAPAQAPRPVYGQPMPPAPQPPREQAAPPVYGGQPPPQAPRAPRKKKPFYKRVWVYILLALLLFFWWLGSDSPESAPPEHTPQESPPQETHLAPSPGDIVRPAGGGAGEDTGEDAGEIEQPPPDTDRPAPGGIAGQASSLKPRPK